MGWPVCNNTLEEMSIQETPVWHNMQFHHFGEILSALFALIAILMSWYLIWRHCTHYLKPWEQRHIIRVLFMVPVYAFVSFLSYYFYKHAIYFEVMRDCYEAFAIASFFALLCHYIAPDLHSQKDYFRGLKPKGWVWPLSWLKKCTGGEHGFCRTPRSGLTWFNIIWFAVFQYCFVRVLMTLVAVFSQAIGRYCIESLNPAFAHIWVMVIEGGCVTIAMYCLIQFYIQLKEDLSEHQPLLKVAAIKLVIFLSFWQSLLISFLTSTGAIKSSPRIAQPDIKIGIPSLLLCIEMAIFSVFHLWAFPWQVYDIRRSAIVAAESAPGFLPDPKTAYRGGFLGIRALMDAFNPWDLVKAIGRGFRWFAVGRRTREQDISYKTSTGHSAYLDPSRTTTLDDAWRTDSSFDSQNRPYGAVSAKSPGRYQRVDGDEDHRLLSHAQSVPHSMPVTDDTAYPRPMIRGPTPPPNSRTPAANDDIYSDHRPPKPRPSSTQQQQAPQHQGNNANSQQQSGVIDVNEDTSYRGASISPIPPQHEPAPSYLYESDPPMPQLRGQRGHEWEMWDGNHSASERDLGQSHDERRNRY